MNIDLCPDTENLPEGQVFVEFDNRVGVAMRATVECQDTIEARQAIEKLYPGCTIHRASLIGYEDGDLTLTTPVPTP